MQNKMQNYQSIRAPRFAKYKNVGISLLKNIKMSQFIVLQNLKISFFSQNFITSQLTVLQNVKISEYQIS